MVLSIAALAGLGYGLYQHVMPEGRAEIQAKWDAEKTVIPPLSTPKGRQYAEALPPATVELCGTQGVQMAVGWFQRALHCVPWHL